MIKIGEDEKCGRCEGRKKCLGMGFVKEDCPVCKGTGKILAKVVSAIEAIKIKTKSNFKKIASNSDK